METLAEQHTQRAMTKTPNRAMSQWRLTASVSSALVND